jgi:hypothetical protein
VTAVKEGYNRVNLMLVTKEQRTRTIREQREEKREKREDEIGMIYRRIITSYKTNNTSERKRTK